MKINLSKYFFSALMIFAPTVWAQVIIPTGLYQFKNNIDLVTVKKTEMVFTALRLKELKGQGWTCLQSLGQNKCWTFLKDQTIPIDLRQKLQQKYQGYRISFDTDYTDSVINDAPYFKEHLITQSVKVNEDQLKTYILQFFKDGPTKLQLTVTIGEKLYLNLLEENILSIQEVASVVDGNQTTLYFMPVYLER